MNMYHFYSAKLPPPSPVKIEVKKFFNIIFTTSFWLRKQEIAEICLECIGDGATQISQHLAVGAW